MVVKCHIGIDLRESLTPQMLVFQEILTKVFKDIKQTVNVDSLIGGLGINSDVIFLPTVNPTTHGNLPTQSFKMDMLTISYLIRYP